MKWFIKCFQHYADFKGRARRKEYWMFYLFYALFYMCATIIDMVLGSDIGGIGIIGWIFLLATCVPYIAVTVRRLHDIGKSGWWILIGFIPLIGGIWLFVLTLLDSQPGENKWGPNPKGEYM